MTSSMIRGRPRRATSHISVRVAHTLVGAVAGVLWLLLPGTTVAHAERAPRPEARQEAAATAADLVLPLAAVAAAVAVAGYVYLRRARRARTRTAPVGASVRPSAPPPLGELDERARARLVTADDCVRTSREELAFVTGRFGEDAVAPHAAVLADAAFELDSAFRLRQRYDDGVPAEEESRRHALAGIVGRCEEAGRRLDAGAAGVDQLRALETDPTGALEIAETRFRALAGRTQTVDALLTALGERYASGALASVVGHPEQARDRLVFAGLRLNQARQAVDLADNERSAPHLRAAEGAVAQAAVFLDGVERLGRDLGSAAALLPAALTGAEALLAQVPREVVGEPRARVLHADGVLAVVRDETTRGPHDPLDALRRVVTALTPLAAEPSAGVLGAAALLVGRDAVAGADGFIGVHRGAVGAAARTRLAEAVRLLDTDPVGAGTLARAARDLAERDVRAHGNPLAGAAGHESGTAGALLGGILLPDGAAASFGGPHARSRRKTPQNPS
ncbi:hypothetical protein ACIPSE_06945 [Streptomyces sp. NPDC090106]|uniref:hypothetical protein n=1 Tax=Streptomyces sp. NPDC090106 TaxID=3365946 RepID=UPI0037FADA67